MNNVCGDEQARIGQVLEVPRTARVTGDAGSGAGDSDVARE